MKLGVWMEFLSNEVGGISADVGRLYSVLANDAANVRSEVRTTRSMHVDFHWKKLFSTIVCASWKNFVGK